MVNAKRKPKRVIEVIEGEYCYVCMAIAIPRMTACLQLFLSLLLTVASNFKMKMENVNDVNINIAK